MPSQTSRCGVVFRISKDEKWGILIQISNFPRLARVEDANLERKMHGSPCVGHREIYNRGHYTTGLITVIRM